MTAGRPSAYSPEIAEKIIERLIGGESLRQILKVEGMPGKSTVMRWLSTYPEFRDHYARARELQADALLDEILEIADDSSGDITWIKRADGPPIRRVNYENIRRARLQINARFWMVARLAPKKYGRGGVGAEHFGPSGSSPVPVVPNITPEQMKEELAAIFAAAAVELDFGPEPPSGIPVVQAAPDGGHSGKPAAPMADPERPVLPSVYDLPPFGP